jgi:hypothetical protein
MSNDSVGSLGPTWFYRRRKYGVPQVFPVAISKRNTIKYAKNAKGGMYLEYVILQPSEGSEISHFVIEVNTSRLLAKQQWLKVF